MYKTASTSLAQREAELIERYLDEQRALDEQLASEYQDLIEMLDASMADFLDLLDRAFSSDVEIALRGSAELAIKLGVARKDPRLRREGPRLLP